KLAMFDDDFFALAVAVDIKDRLAGAAESAEIAVGDLDAAGPFAAGFDRVAVAVDAAALFRRAVGFQHVVARKDEVFADRQVLAGLQRPRSSGSTSWDP